MITVATLLITPTTKSHDPVCSFTRTIWGYSDPYLGPKESQDLIVPIRDDGLGFKGSGVQGLRGVGV